MSNETVFARILIISFLQEDGDTGSETDNDGSKSVAGLTEHGVSTAVLVGVGILVLVVGGAESLLEIIAVICGSWEGGRPSGLGGLLIVGLGLVLSQWVTLGTAWLVLSALLSTDSVSVAIVNASLNDVAAGEVWDGLRVAIGTGLVVHSGKHRSGWGLTVASLETFRHCRHSCSRGLMGSTRSRMWWSLYHRKEEDRRKLAVGTRKSSTSRLVLGQYSSSKQQQCLSSTRFTD